MSDIILEEGQFGQAASNLFFRNRQSINYPGINSCLTITLVGKRMSLAGAHAVAVPAGEQKNLGVLVEDLKKAIKPANRQHLFIIGDTQSWFQWASVLLSGFGSLQGIAAALEMGEEGKYTVVDVHDYTGGTGTVDILFSPTGYYVISEKGTGRELKRVSW